MLSASFLLTESTTTFHQWAAHPNFWPTQANLREWWQHMDPASATVLILGGLVFLFSGFKVHRILIALTAAALGAYLGAGFGDRGGQFWVGFLGGLLLFGLLAWYFTSFAAAVLGSIVGALLGAALWQMAGLDPKLAWSGAATGAVALGLLCFIIFRISVIVFTSLQGSIMFVLGSLGMAYFYPALQPTIDHTLHNRPFVLPSVVLTLALTGLIYQYLKAPGHGGKSSGNKSSSEKATAKSGKD